MITETSDHCTVEYIIYVYLKCIKAWLNEYAKNGEFMGMC